MRTSAIITIHLILIIMKILNLGLLVFIQTLPAMIIGMAIHIILDVLNGNKNLAPHASSQVMIRFQAALIPAAAHLTGRALAMVPATLLICSLAMP